MCIFLLFLTWINLILQRLHSFAFSFYLNYLIEFPPVPLLFMLEFRLHSLILHISVAVSHLIYTFALQILWVEFMWRIVWILSPSVVCAINFVGFSRKSSTQTAMSKIQNYINRWASNNTSSNFHRHSLLCLVDSGTLWQFLWIIIALYS